MTGEIKTNDPGFGKAKQYGGIKSVMPYQSPFENCYE